MSGKGFAAPSCLSLSGQPRAEWESVQFCTGQTVGETQKRVAPFVVYHLTGQRWKLRKTIGDLNGTERRRTARVLEFGRMPTWTCAFYVFVSVLVALPLLFVGLIWHESRMRGWAWISADSRNMYVDGAKTLVTASGIAVALLASSSVASARTASALVAFSAKIAAVSLILCVFSSIGLIVVLLRFYERAWSRRGDELRATGQHISEKEGKLNVLELLLILAFSYAALTSFLVGFAFLGRIAFHF